MAGSLPKALFSALLATAAFAISFFLLFMRSQKVFLVLLASTQHKQSSEEVELSRAEENEFVYWSFRTSEINKLIEDLRTQRESLRAREQAVATEEAQLETERNENERLREQIIRLRKELSDFLIEVKAGEMDRLREEVAIINNMAPANVVTLFNQKTDEDVVKLLAQMKPDVCAPILDLMMAQPANDSSKITPEKRVAILLEKLKRLRDEQAKNGAK